MCSLAFGEVTFIDNGAKMSTVKSGGFDPAEMIIPSSPLQE